jgi:hypothetical protein
MKTGGDTFLSGKEIFRVGRRKRRGLSVSFPLAERPKKNRCSSKSGAERQKGLLYL